MIAKVYFFINLSLLLFHCCAKYMHHYEVDTANAASGAILSVVSQ